MEGSDKKMRYDIRWNVSNQITILNIMIKEISKATWWQESTPQQAVLQVEGKTQW